MSHRRISFILSLLLSVFGLSACIHIGDSTEAIPLPELTQQPISTEVRDPFAGLQGTPLPSSQDAGSNQVTLTNLSNWSVCFVYIAPSGEPDWGSDWLGKDEEVAQGDTRLFTLKPGAYDMRAENCDYMRLDEQTDVAISGNFTWTVNDPNEIFYENFKGDTSRWIPPQAAAGKSAVADSTLSLTASKKDVLALEMYPQSIGDSINVTEGAFGGSTSGESAFGLMCRIQPNGDGYLFLMRSDKQFSILKVIHGAMTVLADWQPDRNITFYQDYNVMEITCNGTALSLRFNSYTLTKVNDSDFSNGNFGIAAVTFTDAAASYKFNSLAVIEP